VELKRVFLVYPEVEDVLLRFLDGPALEWVLLRYQVVEAATQRPGVRIDTEFMTLENQLWR